MGYLEELLAAQAAKIAANRLILEQMNWTPPEPPPAPPHYSPRLIPLTASGLQALPHAQSLAEVRATAHEKMRAYCQAPGDGILLMNLPAGTGKTYGTLDLMQELVDVVQASQLRVLWVAPSHDSWDNLTRFPHFRPELWWHWQGLTREVAPGEWMCEHHAEQDEWLQRGYPAYALCKELQRLNLCDPVQCPYQQQKVQAERTSIVYGSHEHLITGINSKRGFDIVVVDEIPLKAFTFERIIPRAQLELKHAGGPVAVLMRKLLSLSETTRTSGKALWDVIGAAFPDVATQAEGIDGLNAQYIPTITAAADIQEVDAFFVGDFINAAQAEYECWRNGWSDWAQHVWLDVDGLHILQQAELWGKLPKHVIVLDATANQALYTTLFNKPASVYRPETVRQGTITQIAGRMYSRQQLYKFKYAVGEDGKRHKVLEVTSFFTESVDIIDALASRDGAQTIGIVTYKVLVKRYTEELERRGYTVKSLYFHNLRGSNDLEHVDALFQIGTPAPNPNTVSRTATAINPLHRAPFYVLNEDGKRKPNYTLHTTELRLTPAALQEAITRFKLPSDTVGIAKDVSGYNIAELQTVCHAYREAEAEQGVHRARVNVYPTKAYILSGLVLPEIALDHLYLDPPIAPECQKNPIYWKTWLRIAAILRQCTVPTKLWADDFTYLLERETFPVEWLRAIERAYPGAWWCTRRQRDANGTARSASLAVINYIDSPENHKASRTLDDYKVEFMAHRATLTLK